MPASTIKRGRMRGRGLGRVQEPAILDNTADNHRRDARRTSERHVMCGEEGVQCGPCPRPTPTEKLIVPIGMEETQDRRQRLMPARRAIDDTRSFGSIVDRYGMRAKGRDRGQPFNQEVREGTGVRTSGIHPSWVSGEDGGFYMAPIRKCRGGMPRGGRLRASGQAHVEALIGGRSLLLIDTHRATINQRRAPAGENSLEPRMTVLDDWRGRDRLEGGLPRGI